jgi:LDH2 family malate/lactate/ureidoglycolate dehydrogenase
MNEQQDENNQRLSLADLEALSFDSLSRLLAKTHQAKPLARRIARAEAEGRARAGLRYLLHCLEDLALGRCDGGRCRNCSPDKA